MEPVPEEDPGDRPVHDDDAEPDPAPEPAPRPDRAKAGEQWGSGKWRIATLRDTTTGAPHACGATCGYHFNASDHKTCKKFVSIGKSGLTVAEIHLRLKRWLVVGLDSDSWVGDELQHTHVHEYGGGMYMAEYSDGLTEAELDRIADAQPPRD